MSTIDSVTEGYGQKWDESNESGFYIPEKYQLGVLTEYLNRHDIEFVTEGQVFCYPIDILAQQRGTTISIEMKSKNIARGIEQAERNLDFVDYSFLSLWEEDITESVIERFEGLEIGLIGVGEGVKFYSAPIKSAQQLCSTENILDSITSDVRDDSSVQQSEQQGSY